MKTTQVVLLIIVIAGLLYGAFGIFKKDTYVGFFYPNAADLTNDIQSPSFDSLEACRDWVSEQASAHNLSKAAYDYECGKNCNISGGKPYVCEETLE
jgi:hypothetical protein